MAVHRLIPGLLAVAVASVGFAPVAASAETIAAETIATEPGAQTRFPLPDADARPSAIATGSDGALWIAESNGHAVVRMKPDGSTTRYPLPSNDSPTDLAASPDGTIWWVSESGDSYGRILASGAIEEWDPPLNAKPNSVAVTASGQAWFTKPGALYQLHSFDPPGGTGAGAGLFAIGHGLTSPTDVAVVGDSVWVSDSSANVIVVLGLDGAFRKTIAVNAPTEMTATADTVYVVSEGSKVLQYSLMGVLADHEWSFDDLPLITGLASGGSGEVWVSQQRANRVSVLAHQGGRPDRADLVATGGPSDVTLGPDGAIWYTAQESGEVGRIAHDWEWPDAPIVRDYHAYVGEPFGPLKLIDRGSGAISTTIAGRPPVGMSIDASDGSLLRGTPTAVGTWSMVVTAQNTYYGGLTTSRLSSATITVHPVPAVSRLGGADRYEAAVNASRSSFPATAGTVYLASGEKFADALSAGPIAIAAHAPMLLTTAGRLPDSVATELRRLKATKVVIVGGPASVSEAVAAQVHAAIGGAGTVERIGGADRFEVSRSLVASLAPATTITIASGLNYPDALSAAPVASREPGGAVLLVNGPAATLPPETVAFLTSRGVTVVKLAGGPVSVSDGIRDQLTALGMTVSRLGGATRYDASVSINRDVLKVAVPVGGESRIPTNPVPLTSSDTVYLASGENFPDALAGGVAAGLAHAPLYVVPKGCVPRSVLLDIGSTQAAKVVVLGGLNTLSASIEDLTVCA